MLADIFLSYARPDATAAERIARELGKAGWSVWYDRELPAHRAYADVIANELESAPAVLVLWSEAAAASEWVRSEANRARELHNFTTCGEKHRCGHFHAWPQILQSGGTAKTRTADRGRGSRGAGRLGPSNPSLGGDENRRAREMRAL